MMRRKKVKDENRKRRGKTPRSLASAPTWCQSPLAPKSSLGLKFAQYLLNEKSSPQLLLNYIRQVEKMIILSTAFRRMLSLTWIHGCSGQLGTFEHEKRWKHNTRLSQLLFCSRQTPFKNRLLYETARIRLICSERFCHIKIIRQFIL